MFLPIHNIRLALQAIHISKMPFYAVVRGREVGVFNSWQDCLQQVHKYSGAKFKKFNTKDEAERYIKNNQENEVKNDLTVSVANKFNSEFDNAPSVSGSQPKISKFLQRTNKFRRTSSLVKGRTIELARRIITPTEHQDKSPTEEEVEIDNYKKVSLNSEDEAMLALYSDSDNSSKEDTENLFNDSDDDLLANASEECENAAGGNTSQKRKCNALESTNKKIKYDSIIYKPIGVKKFGNYKFPIDSNGYVIVYTDGACENNGKLNAAAGFGVYFDDNHSLNASKPVAGRATNNCGEIQAAIYALNIAIKNGINKILINTDSQFLINAMTKWIWNWKKNNWKLKSGETVRNIEEFRRMYSIVKDKKIDIKWNYTKGHSGIEGNEKADALARQGAEIYRKLHKIE